MTTEIWVPGFKIETLEIIPNNQRLEPSQKSRLIINLNKYLPPNPRLDYPDLSPNQFGQICDNGDGTTSIRTPSKIIIINPDQIAKEKIIHNTWKIPIKISNTSIVSILLPGYGTRKPILIQNTSK